MPHRRSDWHERIKSVEREYQSVRIAVDRLSAEVGGSTALLLGDPRPRDLRQASLRLEGTYLIRMFAEFETGIRAYWRTVRPRARTRVEQLIDQVGSRRDIPIDVISQVHTVREYRNSLVHDREEGTTAMRLAVARGQLQTYFARLPERWE